MIPLHNIIRPLNKNLKNYPNLLINNIKSDSNKVLKGDLFIAISGNKVDGHNYIKKAINAGASAIVTNNLNIKEISIPQIKVKDSRIAISKIASEFYGKPSKKLVVIGITGTNGKTTTACLITSILKEAGYKVAQFGTLGIMADEIKSKNSLTTPDPITLHKNFSILLKKKFTHIVMEVSSHALDQYRVNDIDFNLAIFTNLTEEHLDYHKSFNSYYLAKSKLFEMLSEKAISVINNSSKYGTKLNFISKGISTTFSNSNKSDIYFKNLKLSLKGIYGTVIANDKKYNIKSNLIGDFNSENILAAISCAHMLKIKKNIIQNAIKKCKSIAGRMEVFNLKSGAIAFIDYAHTPDAYKKVLNTLKKLIPSSNNIYVLFGAGGDRDKLKRPKMAAISENFAAHSFIVPDNPRFENPDKIAKDIISGFINNNYTVFKDRDNGLKTVLNKSKENDVILILGKGRENFQKIGNKKIYQSDLDIIKNYQ